MPSKPQFTEDEVQQILARSIRLQEASLAALGHYDNKLSLNELEHIAEELGIEPSFLKEAIGKTTSSIKVEEEKGFLSSPKKLRLSSTIKKELNEDAIYSLARVLRDRLEKRGELEVVGKSFSWNLKSSSNSSKPTHVLEARSRNGQTELEFLLDTEAYKGVFYLGGLVAPLFMMIGLAESEPGAIAFGLVFALILGAIGHFFFNRYYQKQAKIAKETFEELEQIVVDEGSPTIEEQARIDLEVSEGYEEEKYSDSVSESSRSKKSRRQIP